jgi:hypothetical protein
MVNYLMIVEIQNISNNYIYIHNLCTNLTGVWWPRVKWVKFLGKLSSLLNNDKIVCIKDYDKIKQHTTFQEVIDEIQKIVKI